MSTSGRIFSVSVLTTLLFAPFFAFAAEVNDPHAVDQWYLNRVEARAAWDVTTGSNEVVVAVLDSGLDLDHPELAENVWTNPGEIAGDGIDNDSNGFIDDVHGWDFVDEDGVPTPEQDEPYVSDGVIHGTSVAGIIGAIGNNGQGIAGLAWHVRLMPLRILDGTGAGYSKSARRAIEYATANGADVINLSFTGPDFDEKFRWAVENAYNHNVVIVAAVGNTGTTGTDVDLHPFYPACFIAEDGRDFVIGVAATDEDDLKADFSNYGARCTDISAPGVEIFSTSYGDPDWPDFRRSEWSIASGTSVAAPIVSGIVALMRSVNPTLSPLGVKTVLQLSADPLPFGGETDGKMGTGRVNAARAVELARVYTDTPAASVMHPNGRMALGAPTGQEPRVKILARDGSVESSFLAYAQTFTGGVNVALGDVDGDGEEDLVTVPGPGGGPHVRIFHRDGSLVGQFFAFDAASHEGLLVALGDVDGDQKAELAIASQKTGELKVFSLEGKEIISLYPFGKDVSIGALALGDIDGDGRAELALAAGSGRASDVRVIRMDGSELFRLAPYAPAFTRGISLSLGDLTGDGKAELVTGALQGGGPHVRIFDSTGTPLSAFFAFDSSSRAGVRVAISHGIDGERIVALQDGEGTKEAKLFTLSGIQVGSVVGEFSAHTPLAAWAP